jgi:hypothetical protein
MRHLKKINEEFDDRPVLFEDDGVDKISYYPSNKSLDEISELLHKHSVRKQMADDFKSNLGSNKDLSTVSDVSLGYALSVVKEKRYHSKISNIRFGNKDQKYNVKY